MQPIYPPQARLRRLQRRDAIEPPVIQREGIMLHSKLKKLTLALLMGTMLVACSDAEVSSPGENAQVDTGGTGGGGTGGGTGGGAVGCPPVGSRPRARAVLAEAGLREAARSAARAEKPP